MLLAQQARVSVRVCPAKPKAEDLRAFCELLESTPRGVVSTPQKHAAAGRGTDPGPSSRALGATVVFVPRAHFRGLLPATECAQQQY